MEINIKPEEINEYIKKTFIENFLDSTLGGSIKTRIDEAMKELFSGYRSPIKDFVNRELEKLVIEYMNKDDVKPIIIEAIAKKLTPETVELIVSNGVHELQKSIKNRNDY